MSHALLMVITNEYPSSALIDKLLAPYDETLPVVTETDDDGEEYSYNPNAKWDWYELGGRFSRGEGDIIQKKDYIYEDFDKYSDRELALKYPEEYMQWQDTINGKIDTIYKTSYLQKLYPTFRAYKTVYNDERSTFAVLDLDGEWHECGELGWFGFSSEEPDERIDWYKNFYNKFIKNLPDDTYLAYIDYHI